MMYSQDSLNSSIEKSEELDDKLSYSLDVLDKIEGKAGSYYYLKDILVPVRDLGFNVSSFVEYHNEIEEKNAINISYTKWNTCQRNYC